MNEKHMQDAVWDLMISPPLLQPTVLILYRAPKYILYKEFLISVLQTFERRIKCNIEVF